MVRHSPPLIVAVLLTGCAHHATPVLGAGGAPIDAATTAAPPATFCNPLDLDYRFALDTPSRRDVADPVIVRFNGEYFLFAAHSGGYWHSPDMRAWQRIAPTGLAIGEGSPHVLVLGREIYYTSPELPVVYTSDDPATGVWRAVNSAESARVRGAADRWAAARAAPDDGGGFAGQRDAASTFEDAAGRRWQVASVRLSAARANERRLGIFRVVSEPQRSGQDDSYPGDYPLAVTGIGASASVEPAGWMLLSAGKKAAASSTLGDHAADLAVDEDAGTWWSAASGGVGEWLSVDLGAISRVAALQINFAEQGTATSGGDEDSYQQFIIESSIDGVHWTTRLDESGSTRDAPHRYVQFDTARNARFVRIMNVHAAAGGMFAIRDLRIFGRSSVAAPAEVNDLSAKRMGDETRAMISWTRTARAAGYIVRFGKAPNALVASHRVGDVASVWIGGLDPAATYWFTVNAIGEGGITRGRKLVVGRPDT